MAFKTIVVVLAVLALGVAAMIIIWSFRNALF
jgi:hypothetical protein